MNKRIDGPAASHGAAKRRIRRLVYAEAQAASDVLVEATQWAAEHHAPIWRESEISAAACEAWMRNHLMFGGFDAEQLSAVFYLHDVDRLNWPDSVDGEALYLHKVAVRRSAGGSGWLAAIIAFSIAEARRRQIGSLRLDTLANTPLVALYERHGFTRVGREPREIEGRSIDLLERVL